MNSCVSILERNFKKKMKSKIRQQLSVTSPEQSLRLLEVGYTIDTADMVWIKPHYNVSSILQEKEKARNYPTDSYDTLPAWSLLRLFQMLPSCLRLTTDEDTGECICWDLRIDKYMGITYGGDDRYEYIGEIDCLVPINNLVNVFIWLVENDWMPAIDEELDLLPDVMR